MTRTFPNTLLDRARELGPATLHEAAGKIGALPSAITPVDPQWRIAGPAFTVPSLPGDNLALHHALALAEPGNVLVVATGDREPEWGYWGEVMSTAATAAGITGLVLAGGSRDHAVLAKIGFPVFSLGPCIQGTSKAPRSQEHEINTPIEIGDITIEPSDLIVGDIDGVVAIPAARARQVVAAGAERAAGEAAMLERLWTGETTLDILGLD